MWTVPVEYSAHPIRIDLLVILALYPIPTRPVQQNTNLTPVIPSSDLVQVHQKVSPIFSITTSPPSDLLENVFSLMTLKTLPLSLHRPLHLPHSIIQLAEGRLRNLSPSVPFRHGGDREPEVKLYLVVLRSLIFERWIHLHLLPLLHPFLRSHRHRLTNPS